MVYSITCDRSPSVACDHYKLNMISYIIHCPKSAPLVGVHFKNGISFLSSSKSLLQPHKYPSPSSRTLSSKPFLSDSAPIQWTQEKLIIIHDFTGLPWWATIVCTMLGLRFTITFPLAIYQSYILAKYVSLLPEIKALRDEIATEAMPLAIKKFQLNEKSAKSLFKRSVKKQMNNLIVRDNCHPAKGFISLNIQLPMWICLSASLRSLSYFDTEVKVHMQNAYTQLTTEGVLWFQDLTVVDHSMSLPIILGLLNLTILEIHSLRNVPATVQVKRWTKNVIRGLSLLFIPIACIVPTSVCLCWVSSSSFGLFQNLIIQLPKFRRFFRIPKTDSESQTPMKDIKQNLISNFSKFCKRM